MRPDPEMPTCVYGMPGRGNIQIHFFEHEGERYVPAGELDAVHAAMKHEEASATRWAWRLDLALQLLGAMAANEEA